MFHLKDMYRAQASAVIGFGGSYGGMLAAWMRAKYPLALQVWAHDLFCLQPKYEMAVQVTGDAIYSC